LKDAIVIPVDALRRIFITLVVRSHFFRTGIRSLLRGRQGSPSAIRRFLPLTTIDRISAAP
jgi:hypothetical protein